MNVETELVEVAAHESGNFNQYMEAVALPSLEHCAWFVLNEEGERNADVVLYCIKVDSGWRWIVDTINPGMEAGFQAQRAKGFDPIALGSVSWNFCDTVAEHIPEMADEILAPPEPGKLKAILLSDDGCTIFIFEPKATLARLT